MTDRPVRLRKKVRVVEAMQWTGDNFLALWEWGEPFISRGSGTAPKTVRVDTPSGDVYAEVGDWIVKGGPDDFYPVLAGNVWELFERVE